MHTKRLPALAPAPADDRASAVRKGKLPMTTQQIELFLSLANHLNFTKTAKEFFTTQPTVSRQISLLEEEMGFPLFVRSKKEVRLTYQGAIMVQKCREALEAIQSGIREVMNLNLNGDMDLKIGSLEGMDLDIFVAPTAAYFNKRYPNVTISIERRSFGELRDRLDNGLLDLIFTLSFETRYLRDIVYDQYYPVQAGILMSAGHPLAGKQHLQPEDFCGETFILPDDSDSPGRTEELQNILAKAGIRCGRILYVPNQESILLNIRSGKGMALLDNSLREAYDERYCFFPLSREIAPLSVVCAWKRGNLNPAVALYTTMLKERDFIDVFAN